MNLKQQEALQRLCDRYGVPFEPDKFQPAFDLPPDYVAGWVGSPGSPSAIYVGCSPEGEVSS